MTLPPGPRLPAPVQTAQLVRDPIGFLERCRARYGEVFRLRLLGLPKFVYVGEPGLARRVLTSDRDVGRAGEMRQPFLEPLVGPRSLLCVEDEEWERQRKLLGPAFHGEAMRRWRDEIEGIAAAEVERLPLGEPFALRPRMQAITLEVILRLVFGIRDAGRLDRLRELLPRLIDSVGLLMWAIPPPLRERIERSRVLSRLPGSPMTRFLALRGQVDELLYDEIGRRRSAPDLDERDDVLSLMLRSLDDAGEPIGDDELRDQLVTLLEAGHETTATALSWTFERLARHPEALERLESELAAGDERPYLDAVIKESLRSRPVVYDMPRALSGPLELGRYVVPAGWVVAPAAVLVHRAPSTFPEPDEFRPERFLGDDQPVSGWIPFGGGRRRCVGSGLALLELRTVIPEVLKRVTLRADDPAPEAPKLRHVTLVPEHLTTVVAEPSRGRARAGAAG